MFPSIIIIAYTQPTLQPYLADPLVHPNTPHPHHPIPLPTPHLYAALQPTKIPPPQQQRRPAACLSTRLAKRPATALPCPFSPHHQPPTTTDHNQQELTN
ncbi:hypothetical protein EJ04DRAFT_508477 [Polyplosphaeria fusca]|uniref:Uncharacterized protein n=1 Tax=Polyplosphaeria fusca TaxID=682080 RepID=A0A9P4V8K1_9PLEO|nr:hypothetical protein EJ04DRAFT_508477 [Polyplosphaeria fusca]